MALAVFLQHFPIIPIIDLIFSFCSPPPLPSFHSPPPLGFAGHGVTQASRSLTSASIDRKLFFFINTVVLAKCGLRNCLANYSFCRQLSEQRKEGSQSVHNVTFVSTPQSGTQENVSDMLSSFTFGLKLGRVYLLSGRFKFIIIKYLYLCSIWAQFFPIRTDLGRQIIFFSYFNSAIC